MADMRKLAALFIASVIALAGLPAAGAVALNPGTVPERTQITVQFDNGHRVSTGNSGQSRLALSQSKLYLGYWVLRNGSQVDKNRVEHMIRVSDDGIASDLEGKYPQAIPEVIRDYGLNQTRHNGYWGNTTTSTDDLVRFIQTVRYEPVAVPLIRGMTGAAPVAADGYHQNFGTSQIPGAQGTKFGWSNNHQVHSTASIGPGWTIAATTHGPASANTADVLGASRSVPQAPGAPGAGGSDVQEIDLGSSSIPALTGTAVKQQVACVDPHNLRQVIPNGVLIPTAITDAIPAC